MITTAPNERRSAEPRTAPTDAPITVLLSLGQLEEVGVCGEVGRHEVGEAKTVLMLGTKTVLMLVTITVPGPISNVAPLLQQSNVPLVQHQ